MKRRNFISLVGTTLVTSPVFAHLYQSDSPLQAGQYKFPKLPYAYNALEPYIDAQTMELHYNKHHRGYFNKFMAAIKNTEETKLDIKTLFEKVSKLDNSIRNNGGGFYNHMLFWENMTPKKTTPSIELSKTINRYFGSFDQLKAEFGKAAKTQFGSGWAWLSADKNKKLFVSSTPNQNNPLMDVTPQKGTPLLCLDVWEHAYYLHYQNKRAAYVDNFWNIVNWDTVSERFKFL